MHSLVEEKNRYMITLEKGEKQVYKALETCKREKIDTVDAKTVFTLYDTYGFPPEITAELAFESGIKIDTYGFNELFRQHQELSRLGALQKFKGGMADTTIETSALHTAIHLLHKALQIVLGDHAKQKGSNITNERLRFDFSHKQKMTSAELSTVEYIVNDIIGRNLPIVCEETTFEKAKEIGAEGLFTDKYGEYVKVYSIGDFSKEICGGPHAHNTSQLSQFKIVKEESVSSGVRRVKAILK